MTSEPNVHLDKEEEEPEVRTAEIVEEPKAVQRRSADTLAALSEREDGIQIIERAVQAVNTLRRASIAMTNPDDWTLYRSPDGRITGYLESLAAWNLRPLWGVSTENVGEHYMVKSDKDDGVFAWCIEGDGYCVRTDIDILGVIGVCYSNEDFLVHRNLHPVKLEIEMKRTARQRMEGIFVREGAGLKRVPSEELDDVWKGSWKRSALCPKGRGFGTADERHGAAGKSGINPEDIPECPACAKRGITVKLVFREGKGDREGFFGCPNYKKHENEKVLIPLSKMQEEIDKRKQETSTQPQSESQPEKPNPQPQNQNSKKPARASEDDYRG